MLNNVPEAIITLDEQGIIQSSNPHTKQVLKADENELIGQPLMRFFEQSEEIATIPNLMEKLPQSKEFSGLDYDKNPFTMWLSLNPIKDKDEQGFVCVLSDVTAWKQT